MVQTEEYKKEAQRRIANANIALFMGFEITHGVDRTLAPAQYTKWSKGSLPDSTLTDAIDGMVAQWKSEEIENQWILTDTLHFHKNLDWLSYVKIKLTALGYFITTTESYDKFENRQICAVTIHNINIIGTLYLNGSNAAAAVYGCATEAEAAFNAIAQLIPELLKTPITE